MTIRPYGGMVLVEPEAAATKTHSGLFIPETAAKVPCRGTVLAVGSGRVEEDGVFREIRLRPGERVLYDRMGVHEIPDEPQLRLVSSAYVLGVLEEPSS